MVRPLNQFCCGCSLTFGVKLVLALNLIQNVFYIATATSNIIFRIPTFGFNINLATQTFNAAFCLLGLPFIFAAIWGVMYRLETHVRLYLYYSVLSFILDMGYIMIYLVIQDQCTMLPSVLKKHGSAFACGFTRILSIGFIIAVTVIQLYFIFTVWSFCEDLKAGGSGAGLPELLVGADDAKRKRKHHSAYHDGLFGGHQQAGGAFPIQYGAVSTPGIGGSTRIFNGGYHETQYPPRMQ